jgi:hypothetical protein
VLKRKRVITVAEFSATSLMDECVDEWCNDPSPESECVNDECARTGAHPYRGGTDDHSCRERNGTTSRPNSSL